VSVAFPEDLLAGMDVLTSGTNQRRSDLIREACSLYIEEKRRACLRERMKAGYQEMAELNRLLAEELAGDLDCDLRPATGATEFSRDKDDGEAPSWRKV
jgi:CopG family transcriptional regulator/antitoxin EndoAI